jgi:hypothetical protein
MLNLDFEILVLVYDDTFVMFKNNPIEGLEFSSW